MFHRNRYRQGKVPNGQVSEIKKRIHEAIAIWLQDYQLLEYFIKHYTGDGALPAALSSTQASDSYDKFIRFTPVKLDECIWEPTAMKVHYRPWNEVTVKSLDMKNPNSYVTRSHKINMIYEKIFQNDPIK